MSSIAEDDPLWSESLPRNFPDFVAEHGLNEGVDASKVTDDGYTPTANEGANADCEIRRMRKR